MLGVRAVAADAFGVEDADADDEVVDGERRAQPDPDVEPLAAVEDVAALAVGAGQRHVGDLDLARSPAAFGRAEHVRRALDAASTGLSGSTAPAGSSGEIAADLLRLRIAGGQLLLPRCDSTSVM